MRVGVFMSDDGGASWKLASKGFPDRTSVLSIAIDPQDPTTLYAGTRELGLFRGQRGAGGSQLYIPMLYKE